jgi:hypothetical protein
MIIYTFAKKGGGGVPPSPRPLPVLMPMWKTSIVKIKGLKGLRVDSSLISNREEMCSTLILNLASMVVQNSF